MTNQPNTTATAQPAGPNTESTQDEAANARKLLQKDIHVKWGKFSEQEIGEIKSNDDLVTQLVARYGLAKDAAQRDAEAVLKGRSL